MLRLKLAMSSPATLRADQQCESPAIIRQGKNKRNDRLCSIRCIRMLAFSGQRQAQNSLACTKPNPSSSVDQICIHAERINAHLEFPVQSPLPHPHQSSSHPPGSSWKDKLEIRHSLDSCSTTTSSPPAHTVNIVIPKLKKGKHLYFSLTTYVVLPH